MCVHNTAPTSECPEAYTEAHKRIEGDPALVGVATDDDAERLGGEVVAEGRQCLLELMRLHSPRAISVVLHECGLENNKANK